VNVFGLMRLTQLVLPVMREQRSGRIVNISSMGGRIWMPVGGWYHATKHAVEVLSDALRVEVRPFGVDVVVVEPGAIESEWSDIAADTLDEAARGGSHYPELTGSMSRLLRSYDSASPPDVVARAVSKALTARRPRRRYAVPLDAKAMVFLRWLLPDALWERLVLAIFKRA
jgi:short-subunit dehydrogenase